jgi:hypothetical protein
MFAGDCAAAAVDPEDEALEDEVVADVVPVDVVLLDPHPAVIATTTAPATISEDALKPVIPVLLPSFRHTKRDPFLSTYRDAFRPVKESTRALARA